jgi:GalNAc5-diNAcBac-PP-undecaprenol beta-1,3-glucosyltransferase
VPRLATVLVPTHDHGQLLRLAVGSATHQTVHDLDIVIVGDGMTAETAEVARELAGSDHRVRVLEHPKGERHGEAYRDPILRTCRSQYVFYLSDDDLWFPEHVETLVTLLEDQDAHFVHTLPTSLLDEGQWAKANVDLAMEFHRKAMIGGFNRIGLSMVGHTLEAYRRLPVGWRTSPTGTPTDLHMWRQWLEQPWTRFASSRVPTVLNFPSPIRDDMGIVERASELEAHLPVLHDPAARRDWLVRLIADDFPRAAWLETHWQGLEETAKVREDALRWHQEELRRWMEQAQRLPAGDEQPRADRGMRDGLRRVRMSGLEKTAGTWLRTVLRRCAARRRRR